MQMILQVFEQDAICFVVTHSLLVAFVNKAFMVVKDFESIGIAQVYPIRKMLTITTLVTIFEDYFY